MCACRQVGLRLRRRALTTPRLSSPLPREILRVLRGHTSSVLTALFTPDGSKVITGSYDKTVRVWPVRPAAEARLASLIYLIDPAKQLYEGEEVAQLLGERVKRILFAEVERGDIQG